MMNFIGIYFPRAFFILSVILVYQLLFLLCFLYELLIKFVSNFKRFIINFFPLFNISRKRCSQLNFFVLHSPTCRGRVRVPEYFLQILQAIEALQSKLPWFWKTEGKKRKLRAITAEENPWRCQVRLWYVRYQIVLMTYGLL